MVNSIKSSSKIKKYNWNSWVTVDLHDLTPTVNILLPLLENCSSSPCLPQSSSFMSRSIFAALHGPTKPHSMYWSVLTNSPNLSKNLTFHMRIGPLVLFYLLWNPVIFSVGPPRIQALLQAMNSLSWWRLFIARSVMWRNTLTGWQNLTLKSQAVSSYFTST